MRLFIALLSGTEMDVASGAMKMKSGGFAEELCGFVAVLLCRGFWIILNWGLLLLSICRISLLL